MVRILQGFWLAALVVTLPALGQTATQYNWAAAGVGGAYYPISIGMAKAINKHLPDVKFTIETTGGGVENARLIGEGANDFGICNSNSAFFALKGMPPYKQAYKYYSMGYIYPSTMHMITMASSPIQSVKDMKGKRIAIGPAGGGTVNTFRDMLPFYGMKEEEVKLSFINFSDGVRALRDGAVDVNMIIAGAPAGAAKELAETARVRFIPVEEDILAKIMTKYSYYKRAIFPKAMFNTPTDILAVGLGNEWIVRDGIPEDMVYKITKALFENLDEVAKAHPQGRDFSLQEAPKSTIPLHPGAAKYYRERGVLK
jgi:hypothetical protein